MVKFYEPKFDIGDKVTVLTRPKNCDVPPYWISQMDRLIGEVGEVVDREWRDTYFLYQVKYADVDWWCYREEWLWGVVDEDTSKEASYIIYTDNEKYVSISNRGTNDIAFARCHPDDKFDLAYGVNLAFSRLREKESKPYYNGEVVCIDSTNDKNFSVGYVYEIKRGMLTDNEGKIADVDIKEIADIAIDYASFIPLYGMKN